MTQEEFLQQQLRGAPTSASGQMRQFNEINPAQYATGGAVNWQDWMNQTLQGSIPNTYQYPAYGGMDDPTFNFSAPVVSGGTVSTPTQSTYQYPAYGGMDQSTFNFSAPSVSGGKLIQPPRGEPVVFEAPLPFTTQAPTPAFSSPNVPSENVFTGEAMPTPVPVAPTTPVTASPLSAPLSPPLSAPQPVINQAVIDERKRVEDARQVAQENQRIEAIRIAQENAQVAEQARIAEAGRLAEASRIAEEGRIAEANRIEQERASAAKAKTDADAKAKTDADAKATADAQATAASIEVDSYLEYVYMMTGGLLGATSNPQPSWNTEPQPTSGNWYGGNQN